MRSLASTLGLGIASLLALASCERGSFPAPSQVAARDATAAAPGEAPAAGVTVPSSTVAPTTEGLVLRPFPGVVVDPRRGVVEIDATVCLDEGWLEQIACSPGTREHESLVVVRARPSDVHAALLLAGLEPGAPGRWSYRESEYTFTPPTGDAVEVFVRYPGPEGEEAPAEVPIRTWIHDHQTGDPFPDAPWIFAGSLFLPNPEWMGPGEQYVADSTGSIVGLVTFGDEVVGFSRVLSDEAGVQPPSWEANPSAIPAVGTAVTLVLRRVE